MRRACEADGLRTFYRSGCDWKERDGIEREGVDGVWIDPLVPQAPAIAHQYIMAGIEVLEAPETQAEPAAEAPLERLEQHFADVTTLDDEEPVQIPIEAPTEVRRGRGRPRKER